MAKQFTYRKAKLRDLLVALIIFAVAIISYMVFLSFSTGKPLIALGGAVVNEPPEFLFHIYGNGNNSLSKPVAVDVDEAGNIFVADNGNREVKVFNLDGEFLRKFNQVGLEGVLASPTGIAVSGGKVYVTDIIRSQVYEFNTDGGYQRSIISRKLKQKLIGITPCGITVAQNGDIYLTDILNHMVIVLDSKGQLKMTLGAAGNKEGELSYPNDLSIDNKGKVFVSDSNNYRVQVFDEKSRSGKIFSAASQGQKTFGSLARGIAVDEKGLVWVVDVFGHKIRVFAQDGAELVGFGQFGQGDGDFNFPNGIAVKNNRIYVADRENNRISVFGY